MLYTKKNEMELLLLADMPEAADIVARWYYDEWGRETPGRTLEQIRKRVSRSTNRLTAPLTVLAKIEGRLTGAAELKIREMDIYPEKEMWLGGVYVDKSMRGNGVASLLVNKVISLARSAAIERLYLQTERLDGGLYKKHGFEPLEVVTYQGHQVLVMELNTGV